MLSKEFENINKNKSTKLKLILYQLEKINKEIDKLTDKENKNIELSEAGILYKIEI